MYEYDRIRFYLSFLYFFIFFHSFYTWSLCSTMGKLFEGLFRCSVLAYFLNIPLFFYPPIFLRGSVGLVIGEGTTCVASCCLLLLVSDPLFASTKSQYLYISVGLAISSSSVSKNES